MAVFLVHTPKTEAIHDFAQGVVVVVKLDGTHNIENNFGALTHPQILYRTWRLGDVITGLSLP